MAKSDKFLLDTQIFIWWMEDKKRLKENIKNILSDSSNSVFLSVTSVWEMAIKLKLGKLKLPKDWKQTIKNCRFEILPVNFEHALALEELPLHHKDPFDRMLIAQAKVENCTLITVDQKIQKYKIPVVST